ncbi:16695_t:CDS:2 [Gigaspora margarita]|uniref:16695_t:CDS:1 n=1 Tax=Gigaspora margarita TaxID=4874 RepID=A0ABM8W3D0_GIGMA|nr:16695_t:CDS:2 [Gigaspora margarita]
MNTLFYNLAIAVIVVFLLTGLSTEFTQLEYSDFTYTEISSQANLTENPPHVLVIRHYQNNANTSIVHIGRENFITCTNLCLEQRLFPRFLQGNGNFIEINFNNTKEIQDINYCYVNGKNPISIYPLFDQYILGSYIHVNDTSNTATYMVRGIITNWNGNITSIIDFRPSYLFPNSSIWEPNELIVNNIVPQKGFLRLSRMCGTNDFEWNCYKTTRLLQIILTLPTTLDNGYVIIYSDMSFGCAILYAMKLKYNEKAYVRFTLFQLTQPNITFTSFFCSVDYVYVGHLCIAYVTITITSQAPTNMTTISTTTLVPLTISVTFLPARPTTSAMQGLYYLKIRVLASGSVLEADHIVSNEISGNIRALSLGGYTSILQQPSGFVIDFIFRLFNESNQLLDYYIQMNPIITNLFTAWNFVSIQHPAFSPYKDCGYGNFHVIATCPQKGSNNLDVPVSLADGKLFIYQKFSQGDILCILRQSLEEYATTGPLEEEYANTESFEEHTNTQSYTYTRSQ